MPGKNMRFIKFRKNSDNRKPSSERFEVLLPLSAHPLYWPVCQKIFEVCSLVFDLSLPLVVTHIILFFYRFQETVQRLVKVHLL